MSKNVRRRGRKLARKKRGNWFTRMRTWQKVLVCFVGVFVCLLATAATYVAAKGSKVDTQEIKAEDLIINKEVQENIDLGEGYTNVALFGVDSRDGNLGEGNRTDCIIVASLNNETKEIKMASIYRDTLLDLSEGTYQKCNAAYSYGGPTMAVNMLNMNLDLDIQDYVTVDFGAIADAIDLLGGLEMDVTDEEAYYISEYLQETADSAGKEAHFLDYGGHMVLDGAQATTYARIRSTEGGDFTRTERQRLVIEKIVEKATQTDLGTLNTIIDEVFPQISTSFTLPEILNYAKAYKDYKLVGNTGFPMDLTTDTLSELGSVVIPQDLASNVSKLHEFLFGTTGYTPSSTVNTLSANIAYTVSTAGSSGTSSTETNASETEQTYSEGGNSYGGSQDYTEQEIPETTEPVIPETPPVDDGSQGTGGTGDTGGAGNAGSGGETPGGGTDTGGSVEGQ